MIIGIILVLFALIGITALAFWSRRVIDRIARRGYGTARETIKELHGER